MNILLVEDDLSLTDVIVRNLTARGHSVKSTDTAEGAIVQLEKEWPDTIILDVNLPDLTGWEVLRRVGQTGRHRLRVIVMSAYPISQKRVEEFQPQKTLQKPFPIGALMHAVEDRHIEVVGAES